jgi:hypothetical protein
MIPNFYVVEYSKTQDAFHVQDSNSMLDANLGNLMTPHISDYLVVGIFEDQNEAREFTDQLRDNIRKTRANWIIDKALKD